MSAELLLIPSKLISFTPKLTKRNNFRWQMLQKYRGDDLLHLCADNARTFKIWFDDKLLEVHATNETTRT